MPNATEQAVSTVKSNLEAAKKLYSEVFPNQGQDPAALAVLALAIAGEKRKAVKAVSFSVPSEKPQEAPKKPLPSKVGRESHDPVEKARKNPRKPFTPAPKVLGVSAPPKAAKAKPKRAKKA